MLPVTKMEYPTIQVIKPWLSSQVPHWWLLRITSAPTTRFPVCSIIKSKNTLSFEGSLWKPGKLEPRANRRGHSAATSASSQSRWERTPLEPSYSQLLSRDCKHCSGLAHFNSGNSRLGFRNRHTIVATMYTLFATAHRRKLLVVCSSASRS